MLEHIKSLSFSIDLEEKEDISAIACFGDVLVIGADEGHAVQVLASNDGKSYHLRSTLTLFEDDATETDIEDICCTRDHCYVIGSHSLKRKKVNTRRSYQDNRARLKKVPAEEPTKNALFRLGKADKPGTLQKVVQLSLKPLIENDTLLQRFLNIPSKENGIDIEGLAIQRNHLYIGFRSPVLRQNYVPIMVLNLENIDEYELRFIQMGGRGIRAMTEVDGVFLVIGGPSGDGEGTFQLYVWDGMDMIPGKDKPAIQPLRNLGVIPTPAGAKAEGITVLPEHQDTNRYYVLIVYDGLPNGQPEVFAVPKPRI